MSSFSKEFRFEHSHETEMDFSATKNKRTAVYVIILPNLYFFRILLICFPQIFARITQVAPYMGNKKEYHTDTFQVLIKPQNKMAMPEYMKYGKTANVIFYLSVRFPSILHIKLCKVALNKLSRHYSGQPTNMASRT